MPLLPRQPRLFPSHTRGQHELLSALFNANLQNPSINLKDRRLLDFVGKVTNESHKISPDDINLMTDIGWNEQEIAEAVHITALFACFNRVANAFGLPSQHLFDLDLESAHAKENNEHTKTHRRRYFFAASKKTPSPASIAISSKTLRPLALTTGKSGIFSPSILRPLIILLPCRTLSCTRNALLVLASGNSSRHTHHLSTSASSA